MTTTSFPHLRISAVSAALAISIALVGCSSDSSVTAPDTTGQFSAIVATTSQISLDGAAGIISLPATGPDSSSIPASALLILQDKKSSAQLGFEWSGIATLSPGTFPVGGTDTDVAMAYQDSTGAVFDGVSGTVIVTSVVNGVVSGTFSVTATPSDTTAHAASISGTFKAPTVTQ
jgi:hypothetical protein